MDHYIVDNWNFEIDRNQTQEFYSARTDKYNIKNCPKELSDFSELLGFALSKPLQVFGNGSEAIFTIFGTAQSSSGYEIEFHDSDHTLFAIIYPEQRTDSTDKTPVFLIGIIGYKWIV